MKRVLLIVVLLVVVSAIVTPFVFANDKLPSKEDIKQFMLSDKTDRNTYVVGEYVCRDYVADVIENAHKCGYEAHSIGIHMVGKSNDTHAIVMFETSDGDVYVDATQADDWVYIDFDTMKYEVYSMINDKLILSTFIDWYMVCDG
jgi:predicted transglutaminase-like cysteine proteinase